MFFLLTESNSLATCVGSRTAGCFVKGLRQEATGQTPEGRLLGPLPSSWSLLAEQPLWAL